MNNKGTFFISTIVCAFVFGIAGGVLGQHIYIGENGLPYISTEKAADTKTPESAQQKTVVAADESDATQQVVEDTSASIVSIIISKELEQRRQQRGGMFFDDPFFDQFFGQQGQQNENEEDDSNTASGSQTVEVGEGSGFVISEDGMIATNRHVVEYEDASYSVVFADGTSYEAKVLDRDELNDLAILKIEAKGLTPLALGDSEEIAIGQTVIAIGNTLGEYKNTVTRGIVSGLSRNLGGEYSGLIQTDAAINQGNSGGPLLNLDGEVIGINTAVDRSGEGIGFAIPINEAKVAIESVKEHGHIVRPALGIRYIPITPEIAEANNLAYDYGAYVRGGNNNEFGVIPGSAADKAGIEEGDILLEIDGTKIDAEHSIQSLLKPYKVGDTIKVKLFHDGDEKEVEVTLAELPQEQETQEEEDN